METTTKQVAKAKYEVKEISWPEKTFIIKRAKMSMDKLPAFFSEAYGVIYKAIKKAGIKVTDPPSAIYYSVDEAKKETDLAAAVPIPESKNEIEGFQKITIPKSKALQITYYGSYENMGSAYAILEKYVADHKLQIQWMLEEYFSDPAVEKDANKWKTNIYFIVK